MGVIEFVIAVVSHLRMEFGPCDVNVRAIAEFQFHWTFLKKKTFWSNFISGKYANLIADSESFQKTDL